MSIILTKQTNLPLHISNPDPLRYYLSSNYAVLDLEVTNESYGDARCDRNNIVFGSCIRSDGTRYEFTSLDGLFNLRDIFYNVDFVVAHNAKFELKWLYRAGIDISRILTYDTMLGDFVRAGNRKWKLDLDSVCERYEVPTKHYYVSDLIDKGVCPSEIPFRALRDYCINDVEITEQTMLRQRLILREEGLLPVFFLRNITTPVISEMEMHGMYLDKEMVYEVSRELNTEYRNILLQLDEITGGINMGSHQQVADFMYNKLKLSIPKDYYDRELRGKSTKDWPEGLPKTDEEAINKIIPKTEKQKKFISLKKEESKLRKKITGYANRFVDVCENNNRLLQGDFNQSIVQTHRLSSSKPNLQNIDRKLKKVVTARKPGWKILSADYAGLEFRVGGMLSKDPQVLEDIRTKFDVHSYTASIIYENEWKAAGSSKDTEAGKWLRYEAKKFCFAPMYGKVSGTEEQKKYFDAFRAKYHVMTATQNKWVDEVLETGKLKTVTGLIFYFPGTEYTRSGYVKNSTNIKNYPIQMFATADIAPTGVVLLWHNMKIRGLQSFLIAEVHDSGVAEVHPNEIEIMKELADKCMAKDIVPFFKQVIGYEIDYPLEIEADIFSHWDYQQENK